MGFRRRAAFLAGLAVVVAAALGGTTGRSSAETQGAGRLVAFRSCADLLGYVKPRASQFVGPYGFGVVGSAREAAPAAGADRAAPKNGLLNAVDVSERRPRLLDTLKLEGGWSHELLLHGDRLLVLSRAGFWVEPLPALAARVMPWVPAKSVLAEVDVSDPKRLRVIRTLTLDGAYVAARLVGGSARIVVASQVPAQLRFDAPTGTSEKELAAAREHNRGVVTASRIASWLPHYRIKRSGRAATRSRPLVQCRHVRRPPAFSGLGMLTVLTVDLAKGLEPVDSLAVMTDARIVYASPEHLYVATERWATRPDPDEPTEEQSGVTTEIHEFDISSPSRTQYRASGRVTGYLLSQWSLSEYRDVLRVVSTETPAWWGAGGESQSFLTTLRRRGGTLAQAGRVGELGKGERVYAVRFVGDTGFVVTFRQIDPLYTLDLTDAERPRVLGELKIPGYSAYLHPIGEDLLLGVGQDVSDEGRPLGTQLSVFDVSDLRRPARLHRATLGQGWSEAESDHHAFLFWPRTGLVVIPFDRRAVGFRVGRTRGIDELGRIVHDAGKADWSAGIRRSLVVHDSVLTVSDTGVKSSSLATLAEQGWAAFPAPQPQPQPQR
jgi:hypothetical protein